MAGELTLSSLVWTLVQALIAVGVSAVVAMLSARRSLWLRPVLHALSAGALVVVIFTGIRFQRSLPKYYPPPVTPENVETYIRDWAYSFGLNIQKLSDSEAPEAFFASRMVARSGVIIEFRRLKELPRHLVLSATLQLGDEHKRMFDTLTADQATELAAELRVEMSRRTMIHETALPQGKISLHRRIPITHGFTEDAFLQGLDDIEADALLAVDTLDLALKRFAKSVTGP
jgi:hypothetical protein